MCVPLLVTYRHEKTGSAVPHQCSPVACPVQQPMCRMCILPCACCRWRSISLANNALNGTLQANWAQLVNLTSLDLSSNQFRGSLPAAWRQLGVAAGSAASIQVQNNTLVTGNLPAAWGSLNATNQTWSLSLLDITNCSLTGGQVSSHTAPVRHSLCLCCIVAAICSVGTNAAGS